LGLTIDFLCHRLTPNVNFASRIQKAEHFLTVGHWTRSMVFAQTAPRLTTIEEQKTH
jgi:hypothetical protein